MFPPFARGLHDLLNRRIGALEYRRRSPRWLEDQMKLFRLSAPEFLPPGDRPTLPSDPFVRSFILGDEFDERELGTGVFIAGLLACPFIILFGLVFLYLALIA